MKESKINPEKLDHYYHILKNISFFSSISEKNIKKLCNMMTEVSIAGGETLIKEEDLESSMYILIFGRLFVKTETTSSAFAEICPGEVVGEIALLTGSERTATVYARRDSLLLKLTKENYGKFEKENLESALKFAKLSLNRITQKKTPSLPGQHIQLITIAPAGDSNHLAFAELLFQRLKLRYSTILIDRNACDTHFHHQISQSDLNSDDTHLLLDWIQSLEEKYDFVIFVADRQMTPWTARCFRESDRVFFVAEAGVHHALNSIELLYLQDSSNDDKIYDLIFLHPQDSRMIQGTHLWLDIRSVSGFYHIKLREPQHLDKIVRVITNSTIGVVLNGGGARGYSHLGVLRALLEYNIPIDYIGGTSMGAIIAADYVVYGLEKATEIATDFGNSWKGDYTLPYISLYSGKRTVYYLQKAFEDIEIEDLWTNFFCVSCNLSQQKLKLHTSGKLWMALRKSSSIPVIYPPIYEEGDMFVDGSIVNNMPIDVMRKLMRGGIIIGVNCSADSETKTVTSYTNTFVSGWKLFFKSLLMDKNTRHNQNDIFNVIAASLSLASNSHQRHVSKDASLLISIQTKKYGPLDFRKIKELEKIGYDTAIKILKESYFLDTIKNIL